MRKLVYLLSCFLLLSCATESNEKKYLDLSSKGLRSVPDSVLKMKDLVFLNLGNKGGFTMYPPMSALGETELSLGPEANAIEVLPTEFTQLSKLQSLYLHTNRLKELPKGFHRLSALDTLDLSFNVTLRLSDMLPELKKMKGLKYLSVLGVAVDMNTLEDLKEALPTTKILATMQDIEELETGALDSAEIE